jgi:hypothetical protein
MAGMRRLMAFVAVASGLLAMPIHASAEVLYDQTDNAGPASVGPSDFSPSNEFSSSNYDRTADDFTVPAGETWTIDEIDVGGVFGGSPANPQVNAYLYSDASGTPGAEVFSQAAIPATGGPDYVVPLTGAPALSAGTYWVTIQQVIGGAGAYWSWQTRTAQSGSPAQWSSTSSSTPCPLVTAWYPRTTCWPSTNPDQFFKLQGTRTLPLPPTSVSLGKPKQNKKKGTAKEPVTVSVSGALVVSGKGIVGQTVSVTAPGIVKVPIKPSAKAKNHLNKTGEVKGLVTATLTPTVGDSASASRLISLKKKLR